MYKIKSSFPCSRLKQHSVDAVEGDVDTRPPTCRSCCKTRTRISARPSDARPCVVCSSKST